MAHHGDPGSKSDGSGGHDVDRTMDRGSDPNDGRDKDLIGQNLRRVYEEVASEPLPDRFKELLDKLKRGEN